MAAHKNPHRAWILSLCAIGVLFYFRRHFDKINHALGQDGWDFRFDEDLAADVVLMPLKEMNPFGRAILKSGIKSVSRRMNGIPKGEK